MNNILCMPINKSLLGHYISLYIWHIIKTSVDIIDRLRGTRKCSETHNVHSVQMVLRPLLIVLAALVEVYTSYDTVSLAALVEVYTSYDTVSLAALVEVYTSYDTVSLAALVEVYTSYDTVSLAALVEVYTSYDTVSRADLFPFICCVFSFFMCRWHYTLGIHQTRVSFPFTLPARVYNCISNNS